MTSEYERDDSIPEPVATEPVAHEPFQPETAAEVRVEPPADAQAKGLTETTVEAPEWEEPHEAPSESATEVAPERSTDTTAVEEAAKHTAPEIPEYPPDHPLHEITQILLGAHPSREACVPEAEEPAEVSRMGNVESTSFGERMAAPEATVGYGAPPETWREATPRPSEPSLIEARVELPLAGMERREEGWKPWEEGMKTVNEVVDKRMEPHHEAPQVPIGAAESLAVTGPIMATMAAKAGSDVLRKWKGNNENDD